MLATRGGWQDEATFSMAIQQGLLSPWPSGTLLGLLLPGPMAQHLCHTPNPSSPPICLCFRAGVMRASNAWHHAGPRRWLA